jgi:hypothetical protein
MIDIDESQQILKSIFETSKDKHVISPDADIVRTWELARWNGVCVLRSEVQKRSAVRTDG